MLFILVWLLLAIVIGAAASARGRSGFVWFLISLLLSPLIAALGLLLFPAKPKISLTDKLLAPPWWARNQAQRRGDDAPAVIITPEYTPHQDPQNRPRDWGESIGIAIGILSGLALLAVAALVLTGVLPRSALGL